MGEMEQEQAIRTEADFEAGTHLPCGDSQKSLQRG